LTQPPPPLSHAGPDPTVPHRAIPVPAGPGLTVPDLARPRRTEECRA